MLMLDFKVLLVHLSRGLGSWGLLPGGSHGLASTSVPLPFWAGLLWEAAAGAAHNGPANAAAGAQARAGACFPRARNAGSPQICWIAGSHAAAVSRLLPWPSHARLDAPRFLLGAGVLIGGSIQTGIAAGTGAWHKGGESVEG